MRYITGLQLLMTWSYSYCLVQDIGMTHKALQIAAAERDEVACTAWRAAIQENLVAQQCITINESSKDDWTIYWDYGHAI